MATYQALKSSVARFMSRLITQGSGVGRRGWLVDLGDEVRSWTQLTEGPTISRTFANVVSHSLHAELLVFC